MLNRRRFLMRGSGALMGLAAGGLYWRGWAQDNPAQGMITPNTQEAIDRGLAYLAAGQAQDGSFGTNNHRGNIAITSLAGLAFMAGGHQPGRGQYGARVTNAVRYVMDQEQANPPGYLFNQGRGAFHGPMYAHGFATLFLAEAHGMMNDRQMRDKLKNTVKRATNLIISTQSDRPDQHAGGWRYQPAKGDADLSVTICQIMALRAARNAGITVPKTVADRCTDYVKRWQDIQGGNASGGFRYQPFGGPPGFARTAAGLVALYSAGIYEGPEIDKGLQYLSRFRPGGGGGGGGIFGLNEVQIHYYYGHYYAAQAMWIAGGNYWRQWYPAIRDELLRTQNRGDNSWFNGQICPHYCTAMALIILQIPNNYLPILQR